ncbi:eukaryotic aspartyl protease domain-containing protein [Ditylenchus destructor]|uniref:Eukaryotic aspartyl protease domain-containing protein n=1 Tax=Ditylenchus destructor TaxID=166010 RepID=A0AAD4MSK8_9BILA|nr:eukaryotic aspartyl protease domain-containing protein [Ditylenchus destructor]
MKTISLTIPLTQYGNSMLGANLEIGIPPQKVTLLISTQSPITWLFDNTIDLGGLGGKKDKYGHRSSSTFKTMGASYEWTNGRATAKGVIGADIFTAHDTRERTLSGYHITSAVRSIGFHSFGLITSVKDWDQFMVGDGMLGLATGQVPMSIYKATKVEPNFVSNVAGNTASTVMTLWIDIRGSAQMSPISGQLTFGSVDPEHCRTNSTRWVDRTDDALWQFRLHSVRVPSLKQKLELTQSATSNKFIQGHFALKASSNRGYVYGPNVTVQALAKLVGAEYDWKEHSYSITCEKRNRGPVIEFELDGGQFITVGPQHYVIQVSLGA